MMRRAALILAAVVAVTTMVATRVEAQTPSPAPAKWRGIGYIHVDGGVQTATPGFTSNVTYRLNGENGTITAVYRFVGATLVTGRAGFRIAGNIGLGIGVSRFSRDGEARVTGQLPHPFYFNQPRSVSGTASGMKREEILASAELSWMLRPARALDVMLFAGPAYLTTKQTLATQPTYLETYPFDTASFTGVQSVVATKSGFGFTAGLDLSYLFSPHLGLGGIVRYTRATTTFTAAAGSASGATLGGVQASAGLRIRF